MKSIFELFIKQKIEFKFVLFSIGQTLSTKSKGKSQSIFSSLTFLKVKHILALQKSAGKAL